MKSILEGLRPTAWVAIYDLVKQAGVNTDEWHVNRFGEPVDEPKSNPAFCSNWAFGSEPGPIVLNLWHKYMSEEGESIVYRRPIMAEFDGHLKRKRREQFNERLEGLAQRGLMFRVIVLDGDVVPDSELNDKNSEVQNRDLDPNWWYVQEYDPVEGHYVLSRTNIRADPSNTVIPRTVVVDDLPVDSTGAAGIELYTTLFAYSRDVNVKDETKKRAGYRCEVCNVEGFATASGERFVESHHIVPRSQGGPDVIQNTAALCPTCHREAHYGTIDRRISISNALLAKRESEWSL